MTWRTAVGRAARVHGPAAVVLPAQRPQALRPKRAGKGEVLPARACRSPDAAPARQRAAGAAWALAAVLLLVPAAGADAQERPSSPAEAAAAAAAAARTAPQAQPARPAPVQPIAAITFGPSAYLAAEDLAPLAARFRGRPLTPATLAALEEATAGLYDARGIGLAAARVSAVDARTGTVTLDFVEPRLGAVRSASPDLADSYLAFRLALPAGAPADTRRIEAALTRLVLTDGRTKEADFAPGSAPGTTDLVIGANPRAPFAASVTLDSFGSTANGRTRLITAARWSSLTGWNDPLTLSLTLREGARVLSGSYARVVTPAGTTLTLSGEASRTRNVQGGGLRSSSGFLGLGLNHPLLVTPGRSLSATALVQGFTDRSTLPGGARTVDQKGQAASLGLSGATGGAGWSGSGSVGLLAGRFDDRLLNRRSRFAALTASGAAAARIGEGAVLLGSLAGQLAVQGRMPATYDFTVTSETAVRGYPSGRLSGDSGLWLRLQLEAAEPLIGTLRPYAFADAGAGWARIGSRHRRLGTATALGLGASFDIGAGGGGEVFLAKPLRDVPGFSAAGAWRLEAALSHRF